MISSFGPDPKRGFRHVKLYDLLHELEYDLCNGSLSKAHGGLGNLNYACKTIYSTISFEDKHEALVRV